MNIYLQKNLGENPKKFQNFRKFKKKLGKKLILYDLLKKGNPRFKWTLWVIQIICRKKCSHKWYAWINISGRRNWPWLASKDDMFVMASRHMHSKFSDPSQQCFLPKISQQGKKFGLKTVDNWTSLEKKKKYTAEFLRCSHFKAFFRFSHYLWKQIFYSC